MTLPNNKVKLALTEVDYKPFISLFNVTNATVTSPQVSGIGEKTFPRSPAPYSRWCAADYASVAAFELSKNTAGEYVVALKFKNGTDDAALKPLKMFGQYNLTLPQLIKALDVRPHFLHLDVVYSVIFLFLSGQLSTLLSIGASHATRLSFVDVPFSTIAMIHSFTIELVEFAAEHPT